MPTPNISIGQIAIDPTNKVFYFKKLNGELVRSTLDFLQDGYTNITTDDSVTIAANLTVDGNLLINGTTTTLNTENLVIEDNIIILNSNVTGVPTSNAGVEVERGTSANVSLRWNETTDKWQYTNDGTNFYNITDITLNSINDLNDVIITSATPGQMLMYFDGQWVNSTLPTNEPMGHQDKTQSIISFNNNNRQFSISPSSTSHYVWCKGKRFTKTITEIVTISNTPGLHYIYYNEEGVLSSKTSYFDFENETPVSYIYWNATDGTNYFFADERHGVVLDWQTHEYLHKTRGAVIASGFGANTYVIDGDGSSNSHAQISLADGTFFDEDMEINITHSASPVANTWQQRLQSGAYIPVFYHNGTSWKKDVAVQYPLKLGSTRATYNLNTAGVWSTVDIDNSKFGVVFIVATNNLNEPVISILGQDQYTSLGFAEEVIWEDLILDGFPVFEFRPLYKIIFQVADAYTNTPKARFRGVYDIRRVGSSGSSIPTTPVSDHGSMTGLADDDHTQYLNTTRHDLHDHSSALGSAVINDLGDVVITSVANGDFLRYNGSNWINDPVNLATDTIGDYVQSLVAGTGITITNNSGEGATPTIAVTSNTYQPLDSELTAIAGLTSSVDTIPYFTGSGTAATTSFTSAARNLLDDTSATAMRTTLGVGTADNPSFAGVTADSVQLGITAVNEIDTSSGNLIIDSAGGTVTVDDNLIISGNLTVNGTTTTVNSTTTTLDDPIFTLGGDTAPTSDDNKDRGIEFRWHNGTVAKLGFFGYDDSTGKFTFIPDATNTSEVFSGTLGTIDVGAVHINGVQIAASNLSNGTTGSGSIVLATSPTLVTPTLGVATGTSFNSITGLSSTNPTALGTVAVGTATTTARADHVHPTTGLGLTSGTLAQFAATTSAQLAGIISDETGSGALVFGTSPAITTSLTTPSTTFSLINTTATTVNFAGAASTVSIGATTGTTTINNGLTLKQVLEAATIDNSTALSATRTQIDTLTSSIYYFSGTPSADFTLNIRGSATVTDLNTILSTGQTLTVTIIVDRAANARKLSVIEINQVSQTINWFGGVAPSNGNPLDIYTITILKTGASTYKVFASQSKFS